MMGLAVLASRVDAVLQVRKKSSIETIVLLLSSRRLVIYAIKFVYRIIYICVLTNLQLLNFNMYSDTYLTKCNMFVSYRGHIFIRLLQLSFKLFLFE